MTYSELIPYAPAVIGVLLLLMYAFMRREAAKALPIPAGTGKSGLDLRLRAYLRLAGEEADLPRATHRWWGMLAATILAYAATIGAWLPEATDWGGLFATWWWLLLALCLQIASLILHQRVFTLEAHAIGNLGDKHQQELHGLHLFGDGRWYAQRQSTTKYLLAALVCFILAVGCALLFW